MKNILDKLRDQSGFSLAELVVAMFLVTLLMTSVISANLFIQRFLKKWEDTNTVYQEGNRLLTEISNDLRSGYKFARVDTNSYIIICSEKDSIKYAVKDGDLIRNGKKLDYENVTCGLLKIENNAFAKVSPDSILILGRPQFMEYLAAVRLELIYKNKSEIFVTSIRLKNVYQIY
ncbi:MAG: prepilin-type N-terminal cleavage/methylation domain-containing protein [candidate division Zixibacteria bacterium]|nr:prepilin-type N-terminal cleavage/methylation domain-containing protein [candidate division Zixibacteria bacterium]